MALTTPPAAPVIKIKISTVLNQGSDMEVERLPSTELANMRRVYMGVMGDSPPDDKEVTDVQLSALVRVVRAGVPPFIDMGGGCSMARDSRGR